MFRSFGSDDTLFPQRPYGYPDERVIVVPEKLHAALEPASSGSSRRRNTYQNEVGVQNDKLHPYRYSCIPIEVGNARRDSLVKVLAFYPR